MNKFLSLFIAFILLFTLSACRGSAEPIAESEEDEETPVEVSKLGYKIGVITGTVSQGEEEYRAAEKVKAIYGNDIILQTYPDNFMREQETLISSMLSIASDPDVKAIVMVQGVPGTAAAIDKVKEIRDDIFFLVGVPGEDPDLIASKADVIFQVDELGMGRTIIEQAVKMGAKTFVHYSFPRHMSYQLLSMRRDIFKDVCEEKGIMFVDATTPDPTGDAGVPGVQQFILEDVPRKIERYGKDTCFFSTNCAMQEALIKAALEGGAIIAQQCCPSPYHGYPGALGVEIPDDMQGNIEYVILEISSKIAEKSGTGRFSTWPVPVNMMFVESGVEYARAYVEGKTRSKADKEIIEKLFSEYAGMEVKLSTFKNEDTGKNNDNFFMVLLEYITF